MLSAAMPARSRPVAFAGGVLIGTLGGLIGLGGAEFRRPLLISPLRFPALEAVILNKVTSLVVVATALPFRAGIVPPAEVVAHWSVVLNLLAGTPLGAWLGAGGPRGHARRRPAASSPRFWRSSRSCWRLGTGRGRAGPS